MRNVFYLVNINYFVGPIMCIRWLNFVRYLLCQFYNRRHTYANAMILNASFLNLYIKLTLKVNVLFHIFGIYFESLCSHERK